MATDVVMPQMGESIAEGTIVRWIKKVGDTVERDEPLFEISTDKVDAEIPSPAAGVLTEIQRQGRRDRSGQQRRRGDRRGRRGRGRADAAQRSRRADARRRRPLSAAAAPRRRRPAQPAPAAAGGRRRTAGSRAEPAVAASAAAGAAGRGHRRSTEDALRQRSSPLVRKIAKEHNVDISQLTAPASPAA